MAHCCRTHEVARIIVHLTTQAASTIRQYNRGMEHSGPDITVLVAEPQAEIAVTLGGNLGRAEALLLAQAHTLDAIFGSIARRAAARTGECMGACETYPWLALDAQSRHRATLQALAELKQPRFLACVGHGNIAHGAQQVNNAATRGRDCSRVRESENPPNRLLEQVDGQRLDTGA